MKVIHVNDYQRKRGFSPLERWKSSGRKGRAPTYKTDRGRMCGLCNKRVRKENNAREVSRLNKTSAYLGACGWWHTGHDKRRGEAK